MNKLLLVVPLVFLFLCVALLTEFWVKLYEIGRASCRERV